MEITGLSVLGAIVIIIVHLIAAHIAIILIDGDSMIKPRCYCPRCEHLCEIVSNLDSYDVHCPRCHIVLCCIVHPPNPYLDYDE